MHVLQIDVWMLNNLKLNADLIIEFHVWRCVNANLHTMKKCKSKLLHCELKFGNEVYRISDSITKKAKLTRIYEFIYCKSTVK